MIYLQLEQKDFEVLELEKDNYFVI